MSGIPVPDIPTPDLQLPTTPLSGEIDPDLVSIRVKGVDYQGWQSIAITRSCETMPNSFVLTASKEFMLGAGREGTRPEQACEIFIGKDLVITGWLDRRTIRIDGGDHLVTLSGRGITRNLVDCSADLYNTPGLNAGQLSATNTLDLATRLAGAYGLRVRSAVGDKGLAIPAFQVSLGETSYQIIESAARYNGFLVYEDEQGVTVIDQVGKDKMGSGFTMPGNIEGIEAERAVDGRYSVYLVVWNPVGNYNVLDDKINFRAFAYDRGIGETEKRLRIQVLPTNQPLDALGGAFELGQRTANWEATRRWGRGNAAIITCDSWRDTKGKLWTPNWLAPIDAPEADISGAEWIIGAVTFRKDLSGTHADLVLMPPEAFAVEPSALNLFPAVLIKGDQTNPANTTPPTPKWAPPETPPVAWPPS